MLTHPKFHSKFTEKSVLEWKMCVPVARYQSVAILQFSSNKKVRLSEEDKTIFDDDGEEKSNNLLFNNIKSSSGVEYHFGRLEHSSRMKNGTLKIIVSMFINLFLEF